MNTSFFGELLQTISERGRALIDRTRDRRGDAAAQSHSLVELCEELLSGRGEASGVALAREIFVRYDELTTGPRIAFFESLATGYGVDRERIDAAVDVWTREGTEEAAFELHRAAEPRRQELFRRLNLAPGGTQALVSMREDLMDAMVHRDDLGAVDQDFVHLFSSWFNRGFLVLRRIDWSTPALILEKIIRYEAVHQIKDWDDLRRRIDPPDRRCYAFFHPALNDEPLIFVEVAFTDGIPRAIAPILGKDGMTLAPDRRQHGCVLLDLELPARARRRQLRQLPDQAGGGRGVARIPAPLDLRDTLAGARLCPMARARAKEQQPDPAARGSRRARANSTSRTGGRTARRSA